MQLKFAQEIYVLIDLEYIFDDELAHSNYIQASLPIFLRMVENL